MRKKIFKAALKNKVKEIETDISNIENRSYQYEIDFFGRRLTIELNLFVNNKGSEFYLQGVTRDKIVTMNLYETEGQEIVMGIPVNNYIDYLLPVRSQEFYKGKYLSCIPVNKKGRELYGVTRENLGIDTKFVIFND